MTRRPRDDFLLKETKPNLGGADLGGGKVNGKHKLISTYELVEQMHYLYIRIVKAKDLPPKEVSAGRSSSRFRRSSKDVTVSSCDPYAQVKQGNYKGVTRHFEKELNPEWNQVFAFWKCQIQDSEVEVAIMDKGELTDAFMGRVLFDLSEVPKRVPPDTPLSPHWYRLENRKGDKVNGEVMLAVWWGTQADEAFREAWLSDAPAAKCQADVRSMVYLSPKLWYLRVNIIEAQDLVLSKKQKSPSVFVKATIGNQVLKTTNFSMSKSTTALWNEDLMFVVAEPFEEPLVLSVVDVVAPNKDEVLGKCVIPWDCAVKRSDHRDVKTRWFKLEKGVAADGETSEAKFASRIHTRICLEGGYHVLDESRENSSGFQQTDENLWRSSIGVVEVGILKARGLVPMKTKHGRATTDAYCVAKYGHVWSRTRTIGDTYSPNWNEQYAWEVFDLNTVVTVGVFDNCHFLGMNKDSTIGKVRIRISTLESGRVYTHSYPLLVLHSSGVKVMGEIQLAVKFIYSSMLSMMHNYSQRLFPEMHYSHPLTVDQIDMLRHHATQIISMKLGHVEPPLLRKEVVQYMLDVDSHMWSFRKSKANFFRIMGVLSAFFTIWKWFGEICSWKNPIMTILIHILFVIFILNPQLILPSIFLYLFLSRVWYYRWRPRHPPHVDTLLSRVDDVHPDELDEEFDTFPTSRPVDIVRMRYDRLRTIGGRMQTVVGDLATEGERIQSLLGWRDPRSTTLFTIICLVAAIVLYITPFKVVAILTGFYVLRHPRLRRKQGSVLLNFLRRLPARTDCMI